VELAGAELERLELIGPGIVEVGYVVRMPKAYPVYDDRYQKNLEVIRAWLAENVPNVHPVGRNGMHRYNNQDHSMMTALLTARTSAPAQRTTSGRSTSRRSTTRRAATLSAPPRPVPAASAPLMPRPTKPESETSEAVSA